MKRTLLLISLFFIFSLGSISANETNSEKMKQIQFENGIEKSSIENPGETPGDCSIDYDVVTVTNPIGCATNESGSICVTINGTSSDEFEVSINGGTTWVYDNNGNYCFEDLDARNYYLVIKDQGGCEVLYSDNPIIMTVEDEFTFTSIDATSQTHSADGTITVNVSGTPTYYYRLDGSAWQTTNEFTGLLADTYTVDTKDASGCIISEEVEILDERCPEFTLEVTEKTNCDTPNGIITVSSTAGPYPLEFSIDGKITWQSDSVFTGLDDSNFTVYVKGSNGCVSNSSANILNNIVHPNSSLCTITDVTGCIGDATGEFDAVFEGGLPPYEYTIDGGANWQNSGTFTGLVAGDYQVKARDDFGCTNSINRTINDPAHDIINVAYTKDIIGCSGDATGIISLDAPIPAAVVTEKSANESSSKTYSIDNGTTWQVSNLFENLSAGEYYAWVKHDGCEYEYEYNPVTITEPAPLSFGEVEILPDDGSTNGEIGLIGVSGGTGIIQCSIDGGATFFSKYIFSDLAAGDYDVFIKDANDCTKDTTVTVPVDEIVYIPDAIFKAYLVGTSAINNNGDTEIQVSEAESYISNISVADMGIADLTGIEAFVKITSLSCKKNLLTTLDISNNAKLTSLQCHENAITALDVSNNPLLRTFYAHDNQLTELVVTGCSAIRSLTCGENLLTSLDVSDCTALSTFSCGDNQLTELDLSNNPNLTGVNCFKNQLTSLDIRNGNNSIITSFNARTNNLTCISVSDIAFAETNWTYIDEGVSFSSDCAVAATLTVSNVNFTDVTDCYGEPSGTIEILAEGGVGNIIYSIDGGGSWESTGEFSAVYAGDYTIKVKDGEGNIAEWASNPRTISEPAELIITDVQTVADNGTTNGEIEITATGGYGIISYSIDGGISFQTGNVFTGLSDGTYSLTIKDENNCTDESSATVSDVTLTIDEVLSTNITPCFGASNGTITIEASGGSGSLSYSINDGSNWQSSNGFTSLTAGEYNIKVKDTDENVTTWASNPLILTEPDELSFDVVETTNDNGTFNGTIEITALGGTGTIEYSIDGGSTFNSFNYFEGLASGTYTLVIQDENDCQAETTAIINDESITVSNVQAINVLGCFGDETGTITITASGGNGSLSYSIDNGSSWQSSNEFTALAAASYTVKVKDEMGTIVFWESNPVIITQPQELSFSVSKTNPVCNGESNGEINFINVSGGTGTIRFSIDNGVTYSTETTYSLLPAESYFLFAKDANDCVIEYNSNPVELVDPPFVFVDEVLVVDDTSCDENGNGSISITASEGYEKSAEVIDFSINGGTTWQASGLFENLSAGSYTVWVKNSNDCIGEYESNPVVINGLTPLSFDDVQVTNDNGTTNGTIEITASGGTGIIEYSIDGGSSFNSDNYFDGLTSGTYTLVIRDENGCTAETYADVNNESITISDVSSSDVTGCFGDENGSITIDAAGGNGTLSYSVDNGDNWQASNEFSSLAEGNYTVKVKDSNENTSAWGNNPVVVEQPAEIVFSVSEVAPACNGENTGEITFMDISGGTGDLLYSIDNGITYSTEGHFTMLSAGEYLLVVKDENNCEKEYADNPVILENPQLLEIEEITAFDNSSCDENSNGSITISLVTGASGSSALKSMEEYNYSIDNGANWQSSPVFENLSGGDYFIWARNANGCLAEYELNPVTLSNPIPLVFDAIELTADNGTSNGEIDITASGGNGTIEYSIDGGSTFNSDNYFSDLANGTYTLVIKDVNGCTAETTATVNNVSISIDEVSSSDITTCNGDKTGTITIAATGGNSGLSYSIDNGSSWQTSGEFTSLAAGSYTVKVKDSEGNINTWTQNPIVIVSPEELIIASINVEDDNGSSNGSILISASGGNGALSFSIDAGAAFQATNNFSDLSNGTYSILIQDENGCQATSEAIVNLVSSDALLSDIKVNGETIEGFDSATFDYNIELTEDSDETPHVEATANEASAEVSVMQASGTSAMAEIVVTAADGSQQTYTIQFSVVSGIDNIKLSAISIWPNPVTERLNVKIPVSSSVSSIALFSQTGQLIYKQPKSFYENTLIIEMSDLTTGIYTIQIVDINGNRRTEKIVKR